MKTVADLQPGDHLLYKPLRFWSWGTVIALKTWQAVCHCECFIGQADTVNIYGYTVASRDGIGVNRYPLRTKGLKYILRPTAPFDLAAALRYADAVKGQQYDWEGLMRFVAWGEIASSDNDKQFCSEFLTRLDRAAGFLPFGRYIDADAVAPASFLYSPCFDCDEFQEAP
jgi:hypothetical protein